MDVLVKGNKVRLNKRQFVASGGEGQIYAIKDTAYKIHTKSSTMIPQSKIKELSVLSDPNIIRPKDIITDTKNKPIGYTMRFLKDTHALCQVFTRAFKQRHGIATDRIVKLVQQMQKCTTHIHSHGILVVDYNEMNFLLDNKFKDVFFIDVNSYQTQHFPATAIMPSIKDRHATKFTENTDWFSFGIVTFQLFVGIHPYKGKHKKVKDIDERMLQNISVFNKDVSVPKVCDSLDVIPQAYRDWYKAIFEDGVRQPPPFDIRAAVVLVTPVKIDRIIGTDNFEIKELKEVKENIVDFQSVMGVVSIVTDASLYIDGVRRSDVEPDSKIAISPKKNHPVLVNSENEKITLFDLTLRKDVISDISSDGWMAYNGRIYVKMGSSLNELELVELPSDTHATTKPVANIMEHATRLFDGVVIQNLLGAQYVSIFPTAGAHYQVHVEQLDKYRIVDAKFDNNVLMVVGEKSGVFDRFVVKFTLDYKSYSIKSAKDIHYMGLNFVVLDNGICAMINEDEKLELFSNRADSASVRTVDDPAIKGDMKLFKDGAHVLFAQGNKMFSLKMK